MHLTLPSSINNNHCSTVNCQKSKINSNKTHQQQYDITTWWKKGFACSGEMHILFHVVIDNSANTLVSIKNLCIWQILVPALRLLFIYHQISGYKDKSKEVTCILVIQWTRMKANHGVMYCCPLEGNETDDKDNKTNNKKRKVSMFICACK